MNERHTPGDEDVRPGGTSLGPSEASFELLIASVQDYAIFMLDAQGRIRTWNPGAQRIKGWAAHEVIGRSFEIFYTQEAVASGFPQEELRRAAADGRFEDKGWRVRKDGSLMWANVVISAMRASDGELLGFAKVTRDLTELKRQEEALRQSEEQLRLLVESVKDYAIFMLDPQGRIRTWNAGAAAIHGYAAAEVVGRHFSLFFPPEHAEAGRPAQELAKALREGRAEDHGLRVRKDGSMFWADVVITPVKDAAGVLRGYAKVTRDMSEQRQLLELQRGSKRMSEFLAMLAHELRNPLAPIRNAVSIMQLQNDLSPLLRSTRDVIARQISHLTRLVDDLLDVGRIVTGKILLKSERLDYRAVVQASVEAATPEFDARQHRLSVTLPPEPVHMIGDATRLTQALQNLLNNAARYTPNGGDIRLDVRLDGAVAVTTVADNGRGIASHSLERIFELFEQEDSGRAPNESGLGIGLSLARTLVEQHSGTITAQSAGPGRGSTFTVRLPLRRDAAGVDQAEDAGSTAANDSRRVLVVDDNRDSADTMVEVLKLLGQDARAAYDAREALGLAEKFLPQVVLLDLNMPDADGFSVLRRLRYLPGLENLYVAAMTGYAQKSDRENTLAAGFDAHLTKPVDVEQLREVLVCAAQAAYRCRASKDGTDLTAEAGRAERHRPAQLNEVLAGIRVVDPRVREVLQAQRPLRTSARGAITHADVIAEVERSAEALVARAVDRRQNVGADARFDEPAARLAVWPVAQGRRHAELRHHRTATAGVGAPMADRDLVISGDDAALAPPLLPAPVPAHADRCGRRIAGAAELDEEPIGSEARRSFVRVSGR